MQVWKQQLELDIEQQTGTKSGKGHIKAICFHPVYLICVSCEMLGWMKHNLESSLLGEISVNSDVLPWWLRLVKNLHAM